MQIISPVPKGWCKVPAAARIAGMRIATARTLIITGAVQVAIDPVGYMWVCPNSLRNGATRDAQPTTAV